MRTSVVTWPLVQGPSPGQSVMVCVLVVVKMDVMLGNGGAVVVGGRAELLLWPGHQVVVPVIVSVVTEPMGHPVT